MQSTKRANGVLRIAATKLSSSWIARPCRPRSRAAPRARRCLPRSFGFDRSTNPELPSQTDPTKAMHSRNFTARLSILSAQGWHDQGRPSRNAASAASTAPSRATSERALRRPRSFVLCPSPVELSRVLFTGNFGGAAQCARATRPRVVAALQPAPGRVALRAPLRLTPSSPPSLTPRTRAINSTEKHHG